MSDIRCTWQGKTYQVDLDSITSREFKTIRAHTGLKINQFERAIFRAALDGIDPEVVDALYWLMRKRAGDESVVGDGDDDYSPKQFLNACELVPETRDDEDPKAPSGEPTSSPSSDDDSMSAPSGTSGC